MATAKDNRARRAPARAPKARRKPAPPPSEARPDRERRADAVLKLAKRTEPARPSPDTVPGGTLHKIRDELDFMDEDAARVLKRCVSDELAGQIERIDVLLGDFPQDNSDTDDNDARVQP